MNIALFTGTAYRHIYYANEIIKTGKVVLHIKEHRSNLITDEVKVLSSKNDGQLLDRHSEDRLQKEEEYFLPSGSTCIRAPQVVEVESSELNSNKVIEALKKAQPDIVLVYGTGLLKKELLSLMPYNTINLHAGLSPIYKGAATLYWPIYFVEPQSVGFTFHLIDEKIDHGLIIHQNRPKIERDDQLHDVGCKTIVQAAKDIIPLIEKIEKDEVEYHKQRGKRRVFYESDFMPHHLRVTNFLIENGLFKEYVEHPEFFPEPSLVRQV